MKIKKHSTIFFILMGIFSSLEADTKTFAPIMMNEIITFVPFIKKDIGPDLEIVNMVLVDTNGNLIDKNNRYEAGDTIKMKLTVRNVGDASIPDRDQYYTNITVNGYTDDKTLEISELINLSPNEEATFVIDTRKILYNDDNNKTVQFDININKSIFDDDFWERNLFVEKYKANNISNIEKLYVYQTDMTITDLSVKVKNKNRDILRSNNLIDISEDNVDEKYASYCCKVHNNGTHKLHYRFGRKMLFKTGIIGDWFTFGNNVSLDPHETSSEICADIELPQKFIAGDFTFILDASEAQDLDTDNNIELLRYKIQN